MKHNLKLIIALYAIITQLSVPAAMAADVSKATINMSGNVPSIFSVTVRGLPGDLDLTPGVVVVDRLIGIFHFKYNINIATLLLTSSQATGTPTNGGTAYPAAAPFTYKFAAGCATVKDLVGEVAMTMAANTTADMVEIAGNQPTGLGYGIEEDCLLTSSWSGQAIVAGRIPLAGVFSHTLTLTMTSI